MSHRRHPSPYWTTVLSAALGLATGFSFYSARRHDWLRLSWALCVACLATIWIAYESRGR